MTLLSIITWPFRAWWKAVNKASAPDPDDMVSGWDSFVWVERTTHPTQQHKGQNL